MNKVVKLGLTGGELFQAATVAVYGGRRSRQFCLKEKKNFPVCKTWLLKN